MIAGVTIYGWFVLFVLVFLALLAIGCLFEARGGGRR